MLIIKKKKKNGEPSLPAHTLPSAQNILSRLVSAPKSHTERGSFLLHLGIPLILKNPGCVFKSWRNSFSHFIICCLRTRESFCSQGLQAPRICTQSYAALTCQCHGMSRTSPRDRKFQKQPLRVSKNALMTQSDIYLGQVTED